MSLLRWMGVSQQTSAQTRGNSQTQSADKSLGTVGVKPADAKRFGFENFGNTCYANSVLQALYFSEPFRELVVNSPDRSSLYPPQPPLVTNPVPPAQPAASTSAKPAAKPDSKTGTTGHKRPISGSHGDSKGESSSKADTDDSNPVNTGPAISAQPPSLFSALRSLFIHISQHSLDKGTVAPQAFIAKLRKENELFRSTMHQDAHEFLNYLVNSVVEDIEEEEKLLRKRERSIGEKEKSAALAAPVVSDDLSTSIITTTSASQAATTGSKHPKGTFIHSLFEGTLTSETRCLTCETVSSRDEMFLDLSIDIEQNSSVTACLRQFSASEMLCQRNKFFCDSCCGLQEAEKRMKIKRLPNILALHLKRFKYQEELNKYVKLNYRVAFPFQLRLFNTVDDATDMDRLYELWAIVVHIGSGPLHGHYITIIKAQGVWLVFDDNNVETIRESDIPKYYGDSGSGTGYVLFYQAVDLDREALGLRPEPTVQISKDIPVETPLPNGSPLPNVPALVEHSSPLPNGTATTTDIPLSSPPPSPSIPLPKPPKVEASPVGASQPLPTIPSIPAGTPGVTPSAASGSGGFFSSLRYSRSFKADRTSLNTASLSPAAPVPALNMSKANGDASGTHDNERDVQKDEKSPGGWRSLRSKEKRRDSVSQGLPQAPSSTAPSSPKTMAATTAPPSPRTSTVVRPTNASTNLMEQIPPLPAPALPILTDSPGAILTIVPELHSKVPNGDSPPSAVQQPVRRGSTTEPTGVDGSDSLSGSSSWTSAGANGVLDVRDIPPLPKDLPPVPPLPPSISTTSNGNPPTTPSIPGSAVTSNGLPFTLTQSSSPSTWSVPSMAVGDAVPATEQTAPAEISAGSSSSMATTSQVTPLRNVKHSTKDSKDALKARKAAEAAAKKNKEKAEEEQRRAEKAIKEREKMERDRLEREREKAEKEQHKQHKRTSVSRKMSLGLSGLVGWSRDKDKHASSVASSSTQLRPAETGQNGLKADHIDTAAAEKMLKTENYFTPTINF